MTSPVDPSEKAPHTRAEQLRCQHADRCGGCPLHALEYAEQLAHKQARVRHALDAYRSLDDAAHDAILGAEPNTYYRTRAKLMVSSEGQIGLYAHGGGHQIIDIPDCQVLAPVILEVASALRQQLRAPTTTPAREQGVLSALRPACAQKPGLVALDVREVRAAQGPARALLTLVFERGVPPHVAAQLPAACNELMRRLPQLLGVAINWRERGAQQVLGAETSVLAGANAALDRLGAIEHLASYGSFVQAHRGQACKIHSILQTWLARAGSLRGVRLLDAYGGSGAIALALAQAGATVHVVESFAPAVASLLQHAQNIGLPLSAEADDAERALQRLAARGARFDAAIVNPPRRGLTPGARAALAALGAEQLAYVSCDPLTLARDLSHLRRLGYAPLRLQPLDMLPHTEEVETVALLVKKTPLLPRILHEDAQLLVVDHPAHHDAPGAHLAADWLPLWPHEPEISGAFPYAKGEAAREALRALFHNGNARAVHLACVRGVTSVKGTVAKPLRVQERMHTARTRFRRLALCAGHSLLRVIPEGTAPQQVRRHLALFGHPVLGDRRFGHPPSNQYFEARYALDRAFLHCVRLELPHPKLGELRVESPLPGDLRATLQRAGGEALLAQLLDKAALGSGAAAKR